MAATRSRPRLGIAHPTVVPTNADPDTDTEPDGATAERADDAD